MAAITATSMGGSGARVVSQTVLGASDTLPYQAGDTLILINQSGGALTPNIDGAGGTTWAAPGLGNVSTTSGLTLASIANNAIVAIPLDTIVAYLQGVITITGGTGIIAILLRA